MNQIWIRYQEIWSKEYVTKKFWFAEDAKNWVDYIRKHPKYFRIISCGGFEDEDEMRYALGW